MFCERFLSQAIKEVLCTFLASNYKGGIKIRSEQCLIIIYVRFVSQNQLQRYVQVLLQLAHH